MRSCLRSIRVFLMNNVMQKILDANCKRMITQILRDGKIQYAMPENSEKALELIEEVIKLQKKHGENCPYTYRTVEVSDE